MAIRGLQDDRHTRRRAAGICVRCGKCPATGGRTDCDECNAVANQRSRRYMQRIRQSRDPATCSNCLKPTDRPGGSCSTCLEAMRRRSEDRRRERRDAGLCYRCASPLTAGMVKTSELVKFQQCGDCFFKHTSKLHTGSVGIWEALRDIFLAQDCRCAYTGELLIPGDNASLDHKQPVSRGGDDTPENLQWVTKTVNDCKRNLTHDEFIQFCRRVTQWQS